MDNLLLVGRITTAHGLRGEVVVSLISNVDSRLQANAELSLTNKEPFELVHIEDSRKHQDKWLVKFSGINTRNEALALSGKQLYAEPIVNNDGNELFVHELIGLSVIDQDGIERGKVVALEANPASDLLVLDSGALVPLRFVDVRADSDLTLDVINVTVPAGLFEIYDDKKEQPEKKAKKTYRKIKLDASQKSQE
ncbi:MAG: 16S rRNA processing protein RimM [Acidimicrobiales bacterium]|nr:16S rRNA processing protein RimM [Acidimicrobiales bacterium]